MNSINIRMGRIVLVGAQQPEPLYDWHDQLEHADKIIAALKQPRPLQIGSRRAKPSPGLDLSGHRESLAKFLACLGEGYILACQDFKTRNGPDRPKQKVEDNYKDEGRPDLERAYEAAGDTGLDLDWVQFWQENYARGRGNPGNARTPTDQGDPRPPIDPVRKNYPAIEKWWTGATGKKFTPKFAASASADVEAEPFERNDLLPVFSFLSSTISMRDTMLRTLVGLSTR